MKFIRQFLIILLVSLLGEALRYFLPFPIPASVYGLVLMFLALTFRIVRLPQVQETASFLISIMPLMFIPAGVGLLTAWPDLQPVLIPVLVITVITTIIVMIVTGWTAQWVDRLFGRQKHG